MYSANSSVNLWEKQIHFSGINIQINIGMNCTGRIVQIYCIGKIVYEVVHAK